MVVVENASSQIGQSVEIEFIRSLQTAAGKMMFAKKTDTAAKKSAASPKQQLKPKVQKSGGTKPLKQSKHQTRNSQQDGSSKRAASRRPKSREDALIDLVEKQS
ncbi:hypothetical protein KC953_01325, partial [Candidatus Saccharibacteria bacterium]|nr:hypothetical protein [Candidatus Saccharibacteria bacterium]